MKRLHLPHLETDVTQACQLSCVGCNHSVPLWRKVKGGPWSTTAKQIQADLGHLATILQTDAWGALGGEPLLHHDLPDLVRAAHESGVVVPGGKLEIWTNGLRLLKQGTAFWDAPFTDIVLSRYPGKLTDDAVRMMHVVCRGFGKTLTVKDESKYPNFTQMLETVPTDGPGTVQKFRDCWFKTYSRVANYGYFFMCCCGPHLPMLMQDQPFGTDGIKIEGLTLEGLEAYLTRRDPLGACTICAGRNTDGAKPLAWREERDPVKWVAGSAGRS